MTFAEGLAASFVLVLVSFIFYILTRWILRNICASYYYIQFTYEVYIANLKQREAIRFDYDDCLQLASTKFNTFVSRFTVRKLLTHIIAYFHKRRHPEDYM